MADTNNKPVIFLAFANDRDDTVGYLRNLPDEARRLRDVLQPAEQAGLCEVVVRSNSTARDIFKVFQDPKYRNRVAIFHYGGHANGYQLLLESPEGKAATADAGGLAAFLAQQQGLQLVFLNGCSTQQQTRELLDANISAVISTSRSIDDQVATDFAWQFYQGLAGGATIRTSYNEAEASVETAKGGNTRALYFGDKDDSLSRLEADRWPWNLYLREGSENADQWNLPEAVNNPLFGLPPLSEQDLPESPYRHLNWFARKDAAVFFGRGHQIRELYDRLTAPRTAPIMLFYGQSGVGKSSILDAGLIPYLEQDYEVRYLRRGEGGLLDTLRLAFLPEAAEVPIEAAWRVKEEQAGKPLVVFLDQVEELYTRPIADVPDELGQLLEVVKATFVQPGQRPRGKLVLGFRKEWLAELETQLIDYELPRTKVFLEPLDRRGIIEVVQGPARSERLRGRYGLMVEEGLAEIIADDLLEDRDSAIAPTLQIVLTKMWTKATEANYEHPQFSQDLYRHLKRDGILLQDFLNQQIAAFRERYPEAVDSGLLLDILALHTTPLGTADQCSVVGLQQQYPHLGTTLPAMLQQCQDLHLLTVTASAQKESTNSTRLAHDTLAPLVRGQFEVSDKPGQRARRILDNRSVDWNDDQVGTPLDEADLRVVEHGRAGTRTLNLSEKRLLEASTELRRKLHRTRKLTNIVGAVAVAAIAGLGTFGWWNYNEAETARGNLQKTNTDLVTKTQEANDEKGKAVAARKEAEDNARDAHRQTANVFWQVATVARGQDLGFKAAHNFLRAAQASNHAGDQAQRRNIELAAQFATSGLVRTFLHDAAVLGVQVSGDESRILTRSNDGAVKLWDIMRAEPIQVWKHNGAVYEAVFTANDSRVLAWSGDGVVKLWDVTQTEPIRVWKHGTPSGYARFTADGSRILTWGGDDVGKLWDVTKTEAIQTWRHNDLVTGAVFTADGSQVLTWSFYGALKLWDATKAESIQEWTHGAPFGSAAFTRDESRLLAWSGDGLVKLWDVTKAESIQEWTHSAPFGAAVFASNESHLLAWSGDGLVKLWDVTQTEPIRVWKHDGDVRGAVFTRNDSHVLAWSSDGAVKLWDVTKDEPIQMWEHDRSVVGAAFTRDESRVLAWSSDGEMKLWDVTKVEPIHVWKHDDVIDGAMFIEDESRILAWSRDGVVKLWDVSQVTPLQMWEHDGDVRGAVFTRDESRVLAWSYDRALKLWDVTRAEPIQVWKHDGDVRGAVFTRNDSHVLAWSGDGAVKLWGVTQSKPIQTWEHDSDVEGVLLTRDESRFLAWYGDGDVKLWDLTQAEPIQTWEHDSNVRGALLTRDESRFLAWYGDGDVKLWDVTQAKPIQMWNHDPLVLGAMFTHDESHVLAWFGAGEVRLWDVTQGEQIQVWKHDDFAAGAVFTDDDSRVLAWYGDGAVKLWDVTQGEPIQMWKHDDLVLGAVFTGDESRILSWSADGAVKLWDVMTSEPIKVWKHDDLVIGAVFTRDESRVLSWSEDGVLILWDVTKSEPIKVWKHDRSVLGAALTRDESRILSWSGVYNTPGTPGVVTLWNTELRDRDLTPTERIVELEVRSTTRLDPVGEHVPLTSDEWTALVRSPEYAPIQKKKESADRSAPSQ